VPAFATAEEMQAARILSGATMAAWLAAGWIPVARPYVAKIRITLVVAYLLACVICVASVLLR
jgi:alkylhydroperoxidase family enzyme